MISETHYTRNFALTEFASPDGLAKDIFMDQEFMDRLQLLRDLWGGPLIVTSGIRSIPYNEKVGGVPGSQHLLGKACDLSIATYVSWERHKLMNLVFQLKFRGIGLNEDFIHLDHRINNSLWTY